MEFVATLFSVLSSVVFIWACVGLVSPRLARIPSRGHSVLVWGLSMLLLAVGTVAENAPRQQPAETAADAPPARTWEEFVREVQEHRNRVLTDDEILEEVKRREAQARTDELNRREYEARRRAETATVSPSGSALAWADRVEVYEGMPLEEVMAQMPDTIQPAGRQVGSDRIFTWTFRDGSQIVVGFRALGPGAGLGMRFVDIRE